MTQAGRISFNGSASGADEFVRSRLEWLDQVAADETLPGNASRLAIIIGRHLNRGSGDAWPSQETLASLMKMTPRAVRRLAEALRDAGHLEITEAHGRNLSNRYRILVKASENRTIESGIAVEKEDSSVRYIDEETGQSSPVLSERNRTILADKPDNPVQETGPDCPNNPMKEPFDLNMPLSSKSAAPAAPEIDPSPSGNIVPIAPAASPEADLYRRGREMLGRSAGGLIRNLVQAKNGNIALARAALETASTKHDPREYLGAILRGRDGPDSPEDLRARGEAW